MKVITLGQFERDLDRILDDVTDENMFTSLSEDAYTIKVGKKVTAAKYYIKNPYEVNKLLELLVNVPN